MEKRTVNFTGPISDRPLSDVDLISAFSAVLEKYWPEKAEQIYKTYLIGMSDNDWPWHLQELIDALNEIAPPGHFFGRHPDHDSYGFWPVE